MKGFYHKRESFEHCAILAGMIWKVDDCDRSIWAKLELVNMERYKIKNAWLLYWKSILLHPKRNKKLFWKLENTY